MVSPGASWQVSASLHRVSWLLHARVVEVKLDKLRRAVKAGFDPNQPRVPAGNPDGGQWTGTGGGGGGAGGGLTYVAQNDPSDRLSDIPKERPISAPLRNAAIKLVARHVALMIQVEEELRGSVGHVLNMLEVASWVHEALPFIQAYVDPPKTLKELQDAVSTPSRGYDIHHIVEQTPAEQDGFSRSLIDSRENLVRIPTLKHWQINSWYMKPNEDFGGLSPRNYLRGKDWDTRMRVGQDALINHGVLKP